MPAFICITCGTQFAPSEKAPERCPICDEDRQYVPPSGQAWTTHDALDRSHFNCFRQHEKDLIGVGTMPMFAIGQRALLLATGKGTCCGIAFRSSTKPLSQSSRPWRVNRIAISHPHYYASMVEWAHAFDAPIYLHAGDRQWVMRPDPAIKFWDGDTLPLADGVTLIRCGGHFAAAPCCIGRKAPPVAARFCPAISCRSCRTVVSSASCAAIEFLPAVGAGGRTHRRAARALPLRHHLRRLVRPHRSP